MSYTIVLPDDLVAKLAAVEKQTARPIERQALLGIGLWLDEEMHWLAAAKKGCPPHEMIEYRLVDDIRLEICQKCGYTEVEVPRAGRRRRLSGWPE